MSAVQYFETFKSLIILYISLIYHSISSQFFKLHIYFFFLTVFFFKYSLNSKYSKICVESQLAITHIQFLFCEFFNKLIIFYSIIHMIKQMFTYKKINQKILLRLNGSFKIIFGVMMIKIKVNRITKTNLVEAMAKNQCNRIIIQQDLLIHQRESAKPIVLRWLSKLSYLLQISYHIQKIYKKYLIIKTIFSKNKQYLQAVYLFTLHTDQIIYKMGIFLIQFINLKKLYKIIIQTYKKSAQLKIMSIQHPYLITLIVPIAICNNQIQKPDGRIKFNQFYYFLIYSLKSNQMQYIYILQLIIFIFKLQNRMENITERLTQLEQKAQSFRQQAKYKECMDIYQEILTIKKNSFGQSSQQYHMSSHKLCEICNLVSMVCLQKEKFDLCLMFLKKAEILALNSNYHKAITYNNLACYYRRINKYRSALTYLQNALALELKLQKSDSLADTHLNLCAVLSQLGKHTEALQHILLSIIMLQDELLLKSEGKKNQQRMPVLAIAYHNMGVELQFLKRYEESINAYKKAVEFGVQNIGADNNLVQNLKNVLENAKETIEKLKKKKQKRDPTQKLEKIKGVYADRPTTTYSLNKLKQKKEPI